MNTKPFKVGDVAWQFEWNDDDSLTTRQDQIQDVYPKGPPCDLAMKGGGWWSTRDTYHSKGEALQAARGDCFRLLRQAVDQHERRMRRIK